jgi:hypothetical protein
MTPCYRGRHHGSIRCGMHGRPCLDHRGPPPGGRGWRSSAPNKSATIYVRRQLRVAMIPTGRHCAMRSSPPNPVVGTVHTAASSGSRRWSITSSLSDRHRNVALIRPTASRCAGRVIGANPIAAMAASGVHPGVAMGSNDRGGLVKVFESLARPDRATNFSGLGKSR